MDKNNVINFHTIQKWLVYFTFCFDLIKLSDEF